MGCSQSNRFDGKHNPPDGTIVDFRLKFSIPMAGAIHTYNRPFQTISTMTGSRSSQFQLPHEQMKNQIIEAIANCGNSD